MPRALAAIVRRARADDAPERYPNVPALAAEVDPFATGLPVDAYPERAVERIRRVLRPYRTPIVLVLAYLVMRLLLLLAP